MSEPRENELGALWVKTSQKGDYMTGSVICEHCHAKQDVVVFPNQYKKADNHPAYRILKSRPKGERESTRRDEQPDSFDSRDRSGTQPQAKPEPWQTQWPREGQQRDPKRLVTRQQAQAFAADWTDDVPHPVSDDDIPF